MCAAGCPAKEEALAQQTRPSCNFTPAPYRLKVLALVSQRFAQLCTSPELIREVQLVQRQGSSSKLQALQRWLEQDGRGTHVQCLTIDVLSVQTPASHSIATAVLGCIQACGPGLQTLRLAGEAAGAGASSAAPWAAVSGLHHLELDDFTGTLHNGLQVAENLQELGQLQVVRLAGRSVSLSPSLHLAPTVTRLGIGSVGRRLLLRYPNRCAGLARCLGAQCFSVPPHHLHGCLLLACAAQAACCVHVQLNPASPVCRTC